MDGCFNLAKNFANREHFLPQVPLLPSMFRITVFWCEPDNTCEPPVYPLCGTKKIRVHLLLILMSLYTGMKMIRSIICEMSVNCYARCTYLTIACRIIWRNLKFQPFPFLSSNKPEVSENIISSEISSIHSCYCNYDKLHMFEQRSGWFLTQIDSIILLLTRNIYK